MELLKNYLFRFSDGYKVLDIENNNWNEMLADFLDSKIDCDIYLHHFMEMYYGYEGTKEKMYSYIKEKEKKTLDNSKMSLFNSILGCYLHYINISKDKKNRLHEYLNIKNIKSWFSLVLSLEIQYDRKIISQKEYENYLKMILCFLIVFNLNKSTTNKIAKYITRCSNNIYLAKDFSEIEKEFYSFMKKISDYYPSDKKVKELIDGIRYSNKNKSASNINSSLLIFLLKPLYLELINNEGCFEINFDKMNIEHIIPDNDLNENTWRIGNLLILSKKLNNKLKNSDYSVKRDKLLSYNEPYVKKFAEENELFKEENILRRTEKINNRIYEIYRFDKEKIKEMNSKISDPKYLSFIQKNKTAEKIYFKGGIESLISFFDSQKSK